MLASAVRWRQDRSPSVGGYLHLFLAVLGLSFGVMGGVMLATSASGTHELLLARYEDAAAAWNATARPEFARLRPQAAAAGGGELLLAQDSSADPVDNAWADYTPLKWAAPAGLVSSAAQPWLNVTLADGTALEPLPTLVTYTVHINKAGSGGRSMCARRGGSMLRSHVCELWARLSLVCATVDSSGALFARDGAGGQYGCALSESAPASGLEWRLGLYEHVDAAEAAQAVDLRDVRVLLRHAEDPLLVAAALTDGSLDFGMTSTEQRSLGLALLMVGCVVLIQPALALRAGCRGGSGGYERVRFEDDEFDLGLGLGLGLDGPDEPAPLPPPRLSDAEIQRRGIGQAELAQVVEMTRGPAMVQGGTMVSMPGL